MKESVIELAFCQRIVGLGGEVRKVKFLDRRGAPDRAAFFDDGLVVWVELKAPQGKLESWQVREHARLRKRGQQVAVIWNLKQIDEEFPL